MKVIMIDKPKFWSGILRLFFVLKKENDIT